MHMCFHIQKQGNWEGLPLLPQNLAHPIKLHLILDQQHWFSPMRLLVSMFQVQKQCGPYRYQPVQKKYLQLIQISKSTNREVQYKSPSAIPLFEEEKTKSNL